MRGTGSVYNTRPDGSVAVRRVLTPRKAVAALRACLPPAAIVRSLALGAVA